MQFRHTILFLLPIAIARVKAGWDRASCFVVSLSLVSSEFNINANAATVAL